MEAVALVSPISCDAVDVALDKDDCVDEYLTFCVPGLCPLFLATIAELILRDAKFVLGCVLARMLSALEEDCEASNAVAGAAAKLIFVCGASFLFGCELATRLSVLNGESGPVAVITVAVFKPEGGVEPSVCASEPLPGV